MQDFTKHDDKTLCVLMREQLLDMDKAKTIPSIYVMGSKWEYAAKFISEPYYWRHNLACDLERLSKRNDIDLTDWPLAREFIRRWGDKSIHVRCTRSDGTSWCTRINATLDDAQKYFMGHTGTEIQFGKEVQCAPVVKVEVIE